MTRLIGIFQVLPGMVRVGRGTIIFTGAKAALRGLKSYALLSVPTFALRSLAQSMAREFGPQVSMLNMRIEDALWHLACCMRSVHFKQVGLCRPY